MINLNDQIGNNSDIFTYTDLDYSLCENTNKILKSTNKYAKKDIFNILVENGSDNCCETKYDYKNDIENCFDDIFISFKKMIDSEFIRIYTKCSNIQNVTNSFKEKIIMCSLPKNKEFVLYDNFFNPKLDILNKAINNPYMNTINEMLGQKSVFTSNDLCTMGKNIIELIPKIKDQLEKNKNSIMKMIPETNNIDCDNFNAIIDAKNKFKIISEAYKNVNKAFDEYLYTIQFILNEFVKSSFVIQIPNNNETDKKILVKSNDLEKDIESEKIYDNLGINECFISIYNKSNAISAQLENISIKYGLELLNENSSNDTKNKSKFGMFMEKIKEAILALCRYIKTKWSEILHKILISLGRYSSWADKYGESVLKKIKEEKTFTDVVSTWKWDGSILKLNRLIEGINKIIPYRSPGSPIEKYQSALEAFSHHDNGNSRDNMYNTIMNTSFSSNGEKLGLNAKIPLNEKIHKIILMYRTDPEKRTLNESDVKNRLKILKESKTKLVELKKSDEMDNIVKLSLLTAKDLNQVKNMMNTGKYTEEECAILKKYYAARNTVLDVARVAASDIFNINFKLLDQYIYESYKVLKNFLKSKSNLDESIELNSKQYIQLASLFENSSELCMNSDLTIGGLIDKNANINDFVEVPIPGNIMEKINNLKLYPISKMKNKSILMRSNLNSDTWIYNPIDQSLVCQNTLNSVFSNN